MTDRPDPAGVVSRLIARYTCATCGYRIEYRRQRSAWVHSTRGVDHAPVLPCATCGWRLCNAPEHRGLPTMTESEHRLMDGNR